MKKLLSLLVIAGLAVACTDDDLSAETYMNGDKIVGFGTTFSSVAYFEDEGVVDRTFPVNLIGLGNGQVSNSDIVVHYEIDMANSTAQEGVEFDFVDQSGQIVIPAGADHGIFPLKINTGNFDPEEKTELRLILTDAPDGVVIGEQYKTLRIVFVGCQSELEGNYYLEVVRQSDSFTRIFASEDIYQIGINTFHTESTGTYLPGSFAVPDQGFNFMDICGEITVPEQNLADYYSNLVRGVSADGVDGEVEDDGNSFTAVYEITFAAGNQTYESTYTRNQ